MAGVNKDMVYYYFQSKLSLYRELLKVGLQSVKDALDEAMKRATIEQILRTLFGTYFHESWPLVLWITSTIRYGACSFRFSE